MNQEEIRNNPYFQGLSKMMQESILQSGVTFDCETAIKQFVTKLEEQNR